MKTFNEFVKKKMTHAQIEKEEERTGVDLDHDDEKGESKAHKDKIKKAKEKVHEAILPASGAELNIGGKKKSGVDADTQVRWEHEAGTEQAIERAKERITREVEAAVEQAAQAIYPRIELAYKTVHAPNNQKGWRAYQKVDDVAYALLRHQLSQMKWLGQG